MVYNKKNTVASGSVGKWTMSTDGAWQDLMVAVGLSDGAWQDLMVAVGLRDAVISYC